MNIDNELAKLRKMNTNPDAELRALRREYDMAMGIKRTPWFSIAIVVAVVIAWLAVAFTR